MKIKNSKNLEENKYIKNLNMKIKNSKKLEENKEEYL